LFRANRDHLAETLKGQRPRWTPDGFARMCAPRPHRRKVSATHQA
jgi:hypothetical protein